MEESILETKYWKVELAYDQAYLGRCIIFLHRSCGDLAKITSDEFLEFHSLVKRLQEAARSAFGATMFNWSCLMNHAYQEDTPNPRVHWHFRPRYQNPTIFSGKNFDDPNFGKHYISDSLTGQPRLLDQELRNKIIAEYQKHL